MMKTFKINNPPMKRVWVIFLAKFRTQFIKNTADELLFESGRMDIKPTRTVYGDNQENVEGSTEHYSWPR